jgi:hypothetical protein
VPSFRINALPPDATMPQGALLSVSTRSRPLVCAPLHDGGASFHYGQPNLPSLRTCAIIN